jgi:hypothetical protein
MSKADKEAKKKELEEQEQILQKKREMWQQER